MFVAFSKAICDLAGNPVKPDPNSDSVMRLSSVAVNGILMPRQSDANLSGEDKVKRFKLAKRIHDASEPLDISVEDAALLKALIADSHTTLVASQALLLIDPTA